MGFGYRSENFQLAGHVARMAKRANTEKCLVTNSDMKRTFERGVCVN